MILEILQGCKISSFPTVMTSSKARRAVNSIALSWVKFGASRFSILVPVDNHRWSNIDFPKGSVTGYLRN